MKKEDLFKLIGSIPDEYIAEANESKVIKATFSKWKFVAVAACLAVAITLGIIFWPANTPSVDLSGFTVAAAKYPDRIPLPSADDFANSKHYIEAYDKWNNQEHQICLDHPLDYRTVTSFYNKTIPVFLKENHSVNPCYSPLNVYMALAMLAETTDDQSREQLLNLFGEANVGNLRTKANSLWNRTYKNDGAIKTLLASSIWMNEDIDFKQPTLDILAEKYYADSFRGDTSDPEYAKAVAEWINKQTDGLLKDSTDKLCFEDNAIMTLLTTVNFSAKWDFEFKKDDTKQAVFKAPSGDITCNFMNQKTMSTYYWGKNFSGAMKPFENAGYMLFLLPDEGYSVDSLLSDANVLNIIANPLTADTENQASARINYSIPKFDITSEADLAEGLKKLGVTDVFGSSADFSPLTDSSAFLSSVHHNIRVSIDEEGCKAAAYTSLPLKSTGMPSKEVNFVLDRPFIYVITSKDGAPLFVGIINNPTK